MGWGDKVFPLLIVDSSGNFTGAFFYSPALGPGKLIFSVAAAAGTDPAGNAYLPGSTSYVFNALLGTWMAAQSGSFTVPGSGGFAADTFWTSPGTATSMPGPWTQQGALLGVGTAGIELAFPSGGGNFNGLLLNANQLQLGASPGQYTWYQPSGGDDLAGLTAALAAGSVMLTPGTFQLSGQLTVAGATLQGCDMASIIKPFGGYTGSLLAAGNKGSIRNLSIQNSGTSAITIAGGIAEWWLTDLYFASNHDWCIDATITGATHGRIRGIRGAGGGASNGGGISLNGGTGAAVTAEVNIYDIDIQNLLIHSALFCSAVTDIRCDGPFNCAAKSTNTAPVVHIQGACQSISISDLDLGGGAATGVMVIEDAGGNSPSELNLGPGVVQDSGGAGVIVSGGAARVWFDRVMSKRNQGDGWLWGGTGAFNRMSGCGGNLNNQAAGTAYDVDVTSTAHLLNDGFSYVSGGVTAGRNLTSALNHYTEANAPSSLTTAGNAPGGW